jgi:hypothetical protein
MTRVHSFIYTPYFGDEAKWFGIDFFSPRNASGGEDDNGGAFKAIKLVESNNLERIENQMMIS